MTQGPAPEPSQFGLLRSRRFWPLFWVQFLGAFNDQCFKTAFVALLTWRLARERGLEGELDLLVQVSAALFILPFALISPTAGLISDRVDKAVMMRWVKFAEIVLMALAALAFQVQNVTLLFVLLFAMGAQSAFFAPIKYAVLPRYLARHELVAGNGLVQAATFLAIILGQIAGAKLVLTEDGVTVASIAVIVIAVAGWLASLRARPVPPLGPAPRVDWLLPRAMVHSLRDGARWPEPFFAILLSGWFWFTGAAVLSFIPPLAKENLHGTEDVALLLLVTFSVGVALGALMCNRVLRGAVSYRTAPLGALGILAGMLIFRAGLAGYGADIAPDAPLLDGVAFLARADAWPLLAGFTLMAAAAGLYVVPLSVVYQATSPEGERGRFVACSNVVDSISMVVSALLAIALVAAGLAREDVMVVFGLSGIGAAALIWRHHRAGPDLSTPHANETR
ncbi:MFS transporter [Oceanicella sp. SM1341]|uniref:MFS transporter n=1 Tax=Oceanicella sp. SM1341 TaxID=1548889 RepID=UPI000E4920FC|nr:MFS transporter [Oceanicella sp. SM1341]